MIALIKENHHFEYRRHMWMQIMEIVVGENTHIVNP